MPKYQKGETSPENKKNSEKITNSIITKTKILNNALTLDKIPSYIPLNANRRKINIGDIHSWENKELDVFKYTVNTAKTEKNQPFLNKLLDAIYNFNKKVPHWINKEDTEKKVKKSTYKTRADLEFEINTLKNTTETLNNVVVEVFRGYEQLKSFIVTHHFDNKQYHTILKSHFHVNPKDRLKLIK